MLFFMLEKHVNVEVLINVPVSCIFVQLNKFVQHLVRGKLPVPTSSHVGHVVSHSTVLLVDYWL
jgi:hypothetical protein